MDNPIKATPVEPGSERHLTLLMAPYHLNLVTGQDRQHLLAWGSDVWNAAIRYATGFAKELVASAQAGQPTVAWAIVNAKGELINTSEVRELLATPEECDRVYPANAPHRVRELVFKDAA
jgi:hypothetical protein